MLGGSRTGWAGWMKTKQKMEWRCRQRGIEQMGGDGTGQAGWGRWAGGGGIVDTLAAPQNS